MSQTTTHTRYVRGIVAGGLLIAAVVGLMLLFASEEPATRSVDPDAAEGSTFVEMNEALAGVGSADALEGAPALVGRGDERARPTGPSSGPVRVLVTGLGGRPLAGVPVELSGADRGEGAMQAPVTTDAHGAAHFADVAYDGTRRVRVVEPGAALLGPTPLPSSGYGAVSRSRVRSSQHPGVAVRGPETVLALHRGLPLHVTLARIAADSATSSAGLRGVGWQTAQAWQPPGQGFLPWGESGATLVIPVGSGEAFALTLNRSEGSGFAGPTKTTMNVTASPLAFRLVAHVPVWTEAQILVVPPADAMLGRVVEGSARAHVGKQQHECVAALDGYGRLVLSGVPYVPGATLSMAVAFEDGRAVVAKGRFGFEASTIALEGRVERLEALSVRESR